MKSEREAFWNAVDILYIDGMFRGVGGISMTKVFGIDAFENLDFLLIYAKLEPEHFVMACALARLIEHPEEAEE